jgi:four helix bundle protein
MGNFKDLRAWQEARSLAGSVYRVSAAFPSEERFGLTRQIRRAADSIPANIAEGHGRVSPRDQAQFFGIALGSAQETETFLLLAADRDFADASALGALIRRSRAVQQMLSGLLRYSRRRRPN